MTILVEHSPKFSVLTWQLLMFRAVHGASSQTVPFNASPRTERREVQARPIVGEMRQWFQCNSEITRHLSSTLKSQTKITKEMVELPQGKAYACFVPTHTYRRKVTAENVTFRNLGGYFCSLHTSRILRRILTGRSVTKR